MNGKETLEQHKKLSLQKIDNLMNYMAVSSHNQVS